MWTYEKNKNYENTNWWVERGVENVNTVNCSHEPRQKIAEFTMEKQEKNIDLYDKVLFKLHGVLTHPET